MTLPINISTRGFDLESKGKLLNIAEATLANAATLAHHPVRLSEFETAVGNLEDAIANASGVARVYVDTSLGTLSEVLATATFSGGEWSFPGGKKLGVGDILIIHNATNQDTDRSWIVATAGGTNADFEAFGSDINQAISDAVDILKGSATVYTDLGLVETELNALSSDVSSLQSDVSTLQNSIVGFSKSVEYAVTWGAADGNGIYSATVDTSDDFGTYKVSVEVFKSLGNGIYEHISKSALMVASNNSEVRLATDSATLHSATLKVVVTGVPAV